MKAVSLLVAPAWVGDAVMSEPLIRQIAAHDHAPVDILAPPWVAPLYERMPNVGKVILAPFAHGRLDLKARWHLGQTLRASGYQNAYVLPNSLKSALPTFFAGIPNRIGFTGESRYGLINRRQKLDKQKLPRMVDRFLALGPTATGGADADMPQLSANSDSFEALRSALELATPNRLAVLCPGAEYGPAKRWPAEHFATLAQQLDQAGYTVWIIGSAKDKEAGVAIESLSNGLAINLCGRTKLAEAIDLMSAADIVVSNDSGLMHVAAALQRPLIALFGSSSPLFTPPLTKQVAILQHAVPCSPCFARTCRYGHMDCLTQLLPDTVMTAIRTLTPKSHTA